MKNLKFLVIWLLGFSPTCIAGEGIYSWDQPIPGGKESIFTSTVCALGKISEFPGIPSQPTESQTWIRGIKHPDHSTYIGVVKRIWIRAPLAKIEHLVGDFEQYPARTSELKEVKVLEKEGNRTLTYWEIRSPLFFVPNTRNRQYYVTDLSQPKRMIYRYQLKESNNLHYSDGVLILEDMGDVSRLTSFDFFDADFGIAKAIAVGKIWKQSLEGYFRSSVALKFQAENPDWKLKEIESHVDDFVDAHPIDPIQYYDLNTVLPMKAEKLDQSTKEKSEKPEKLEKAQDKLEKSEKVENRVEKTDKTDAGKEQKIGDTHTPSPATSKLPSVPNK